MNRVQKMIVVLGLALASLSAFAGYEPWLQGPCADDAKRLCAEALAAGGKILDCMRAHQAELSPGCKLKREERRAEMSAVMGDVKKDCAADMEKFCRKPSAPKPVGERTGAHGCMHDHYAELSPACKAHFEAAESRRPVPPKKKPATEAGESSTSIQRESSDLAVAIAKRRALIVGEPLSPAERTMTLAYAATGKFSKTTSAREAESRGDEALGQGRDEQPLPEEDALQ